MAAKKAGKAKLAKASRRSADKKPRDQLLALKAGKRAKRKTRAQTSRKRIPRALEVQLRRTMAEMGLTAARKVFASVEAAFDE